MKYLYGFNVFKSIIGTSYGLYYSNNNHLGDIICKINVGAESRTNMYSRTGTAVQVHILTFITTTVLTV